MHPIRRLALVLPLSLLAACGDGPSEPRNVAPRSFAFSHIAGYAPDSGFVCPAPAPGAVSRIFAGGDGAEVFRDGRIWVNVYVSTWERYPSTAQSSHSVLYNRMGSYRRDGDTLTLTGFEDTALLGKAYLGGDSLRVRVTARCASETEIEELSLIFKEILP